MNEIIKAIPKWVITGCFLIFVVILFERIYISKEGIEIFGNNFGPSKETDIDNKVSNIQKNLDGVEQKIEDINNKIREEIISGDKRSSIEIGRLKSWVCSEMRGLKTSEFCPDTGDSGYVVMAATLAEPKGFRNIMKRIEKDNKVFYDEVIETISVCHKKGLDAGLVIGEYTDKSTAERLAKRAADNGFSEGPYPLSREDYYAKDISKDCKNYVRWVFDNSK